MSGNSLNFFKDSFYFRIVILIILFPLNLLYAQKHKSGTDGQTVQIYLENGAQLFSAEQNFNQQITQKKIVLTNAEVSSKDTGDIMIYTASALEKSTNQKFSQKIKTKLQQKGTDAIRRVREIVYQFEAKKKSNDIKNYQETPPTSHFFSLHAASKNCTFPTYYGNDLSHTQIRAKDFSIKHALDYLHDFHFTLYNNKSLDFCFSEAFYLRPPPYYLI